MSGTNGLFSDGLFRGTGEEHPIDLPAAPPWRVGGQGATHAERGETFRPGNPMIAMVNTALLLRRPLMITGKPGTGKSSLIYAVARELQLGKVLRWPVTSRSTLRQALYEYDAIGRMQEAQLTNAPPDIGGFVRLGALGTALLPSAVPRALLIDEIDKADIDLPNDLLDIFEEGEFSIPELSRLKTTRPVAVKTYDGDLYEVSDGHIRCQEFPFVVMTSNGERDFAPAFLRRCLQLEVAEPTHDELVSIVRAHLAAATGEAADKLIGEFVTERNTKVLSTDQLLNAVFLITGGRYSATEAEDIKKIVFKQLASL